MNLIVGFGGDSVIMLALAEIMQEQVQILALLNLTTGEIQQPLTTLGQLDLIDDAVLSEDRAKNKEVFEGAARLLLGGPELLLKVFMPALRLYRPGVVLPLPDNKRRCD